MPEPTLESSPASQPVQQPECQRFEEVLQRLQQAAQAQGQENAVLRVQAGKSVVYKGISSHDPVPENIPINAVQKVLQAVEEPQALNGTVKLSVNNEVVFYNQKGVVSEDSYNLALQQQVTQELQAAPQPESQAAPAIGQLRQDGQALTEALQPQASVEAKPQPEAAAPAKGQTAMNLEQRKGQIAQPEPLVAKQQQQPRQTEGHTNMVSSIPASPLNNKAENWLQGIRNKVENTLLGAVKQTIKTGAAVLGETRPDGSVVVHSKSRNQSLVVKGNDISIKESSAIDPKAAWTQYSEKVQVKGPFQTAAAVARTAWKEGVPEPDIRKILSANPAIKQFGKKDQELVELPLQKVKREVALSQQPQQQVQQWSKDNSLSL